MGKQLAKLTLWACMAGIMAGTVAQAADPDLIAWWKLDDGAGTVALDSSGYENHGTVLGPDAGLGIDGSVWFNDPERGMVISFAGTSACVDTGVTIPAMTLENDFTWAFWAKQHADQATNNDMILGNRYGGTSSPLQFIKFTPTRFENYNDDGSYVNGVNYASIPTDVWIHHALVKDGAELTYYRDGEVFMTNTMTKTVDENPFYMGADGYSGVQEAWQGYLSDVRLYTRALTQEEVQRAMAGMGPISEVALDPIPEIEAVDVWRDAVLSWTPGDYAETHDVYFGTTLEDVTNADRANPMGVLVNQGQAAATYDPDGLLELGQTYYWRIDEVNAAPDNTIFKGEIWSFTAEPLAYPVEGIVATCNVASDEDAGPENTVNGSGLNADDQHSTESGDMWLATPAAGETIELQFEFAGVYKLHQMLVWNYNAMFEMLLGFSLQDVTVESSVDGVEWTLVGDVVFAQGTSSPDYTANTTVDFGGAAVKYVRLTVNSGYGTRGSYGLSEVRFLYIPAQAREPEPADGAAEVSPETMLSWRPGREASSHEVYLGTDAADLALLETAGEPSATPGDLAFGATYYWRVDEVNEAEAISVWSGDVWSFVVQEFGLIDGFEDYDNEDNPIYDTWIDGWINETGSTVGYLTEPFAERTIVNSGAQSMPLAYDNSVSPFYSEAEYDLGGMDLAANGADTLQLYVHGDTTNTAETLYVALANSNGQMAVVSHSDATVIQGDTWVEWQIPLSEFSGVNLASVATIYVGVGDRANPTAGGTGIIYVDDIGYGHPAE